MALYDQNSSLDQEEVGKLYLEGLSAKSRD